MTDIVAMLRSHAAMSITGAFQRAIMLEAADRIEKYERQEAERAKMDVSLNQKLKEDKANAYKAMLHIGESNDIWQNEDVYNLAKGVYDIITKIEKEDK